MRTQLHWVCSQPTPYNDYLFRCLAGQGNWDLTVHFLNRSLASHPWTQEMAQGFAWRPLPNRYLDRELLSVAMRHRDAFFVVANWQHPGVLLLLNTLILMRREFAIWTDTPRLKQRYGRLKEMARSAWLKLLFHSSRRVLGTGKPAISALAAMGCPTKLLVNFPFFVDLSLFAPSNQVPDASREVIFLSAGRLVNSIKGHDLALRALALSRERLGPTCRPFRYRIAGVGPDRECLATLAQNLGLSTGVEFIGWLEASEVPNFYHSGHVLLHPSHRDNFPAAVLEAMASGLAIVGSDVTGVVIDRIVHGHNGLIHRAGNVSDLSDQICRLLVQPGYIDALGSRARATAEEWPITRAVEIIGEVLRGFTALQ